MRKALSALVAALLVTSQAHVAAAAEKPEPSLEDPDGSLRKSKKAERVVILLKSLGLAHPSLTEWVQDVDARYKDGYVTFYEERMGEGAWSLRYEAKARVNLKQLELRYVPDDSNTEYSVRTNAVMVKYKLKF